MPAFIDFRNAVSNQLNTMFKNCDYLYYTEATPDELYEKYLSFFPAGTNNLFRERTEHDCSSCRSFIRQMANVVGVKGNKLLSVWDVVAEGFYQDVANSMSEFVKSRAIETVFLTEVSKIGVDKNFEMQEDGSVKTWNHFFAVVPAQFVKSNIGEISGRDPVLFYNSSAALGLPVSVVALFINSSNQIIAKTQLDNFASDTIVSQVNSTTLLSKVIENNKQQIKVFEYSKV